MRSGPGRGSGLGLELGLRPGSGLEQEAVPGPGPRPGLGPTHCWSRDRHQEHDLPIHADTGHERMFVESQSHSSSHCFGTSKGSILAFIAIYCHGEHQIGSLVASGQTSLTRQVQLMGTSFVRKVRIHPALLQAVENTG